MADRSYSEVYDWLVARAKGASKRGESGELAAVRGVILAGGRGTRLAPYTSVLPKPLMPVGEHSILEIVLDQLSAAGVTNITLCVGYLSHLIRASSTTTRTAPFTWSTSTRTNRSGQLLR